MASFILFIAVLLAGASFVFYTAGSVAGHGSAWASNLCSAAFGLCDRPELLGVAAIGFGGLYIIVKIVSALRG